MVKKNFKQNDLPSPLQQVLAILTEYGLKLSWSLRKWELEKNCSMGSFITCKNVKFNFNDTQPVFFFLKFSLCNAKTALNIHSPSQPFASHVYLNLQDKFYWHPQPARIGNFARRSNCNRDSFPLLCHDYHDRSHDLIGLHITLLQRTCSQDRTIVMVHAVTAHQI